MTFKNASLEKLFVHPLFTRLQHILLDTAVTLANLIPRLYQKNYLYCCDLAHVKSPE